MAITVLVFFIFGTAPDLFSQKKNETPTFIAPNMPVDESTKLINYTTVVESKGAKSDLYAKGMKWFNTFYKNPNEVIREKSEEDGKIVGKGRIKIMEPPDKKGVEAMAGIVMYTITVYFKDGKFRSEITNFNLQSTSYTAIEFWMDKESKVYMNKYDYYLTQVDNSIKELKENLSKFMKTDDAKKADNW